MRVYETDGQMSQRGNYRPSRQPKCHNTKNTKAVFIFILVLNTSRRQKPFFFEITKNVGTLKYKNCEQIYNVRLAYKYNLKWWGDFHGSVVSLCTPKNIGQ